MFLICERSSTNLSDLIIEYYFCFIYSWLHAKLDESLSHSNASYLAGYPFFSRFHWDWTCCTSNSPFICTWAAFFKLLLSFPCCLIYQTMVSLSHLRALILQPLVSWKADINIHVRHYVHVNIQDLPDYTVLLLPKLPCKLASSQLRISPFVFSAVGIQVWPVWVHVVEMLDAPKQRCVGGSV